jgi:SagB-type dehydrogenase family enzyme
MDIATAMAESDRAIVSVKQPEIIILPAPDTAGGMPLAQALAERRSIREFSAKQLSADQLAQLLWSIQGITDPSGRRTTPSAGATYPLELYVVLAEGLYHYSPKDHRLVKKQEGDLRKPLAAAALYQESVLQAPAVFVISAVSARTESRYGPTRAPRYVMMEVGHAAQNLLLQAVALGLGAVLIGAFRDSEVHKILSLPDEEAPLYLVPVGYSR